MIMTIASREVRSLFLSPLAWSILAVVQFIMGYLFLGQLDLFLQIQSRLVAMNDAPGITEIVVTPIFANAAMILLLVIPLITMRLISEEKRTQTLTLLLSAPVSITEIVLGKFIGIMFFILIMLLLMALMPLSLLAGGTLDYGMVASAFLALLLLLASFASAGLFMSTITNQPTIAAISTFGLLLLLWIIDWSADFAKADTVLSYLSLLNHYRPLLEGIFKSSDIIYYLLFIITFLTLSIRRLNADRLQH